MTIDHLQRVRRATDHLDGQRDLSATADTAWRKAIRDALTAGESATDVAVTAGVSRARVYQIKDGTR